MSGFLDIGDHMAPQTFGPYTSENLAAYAAASGDDNPLHLDPAVAARAGLSALPVHGMLMMGCFAPAITNWRPDLAIARLSVRFLRPVLVGERVSATARVVKVEHGEPPTAVLRLMAHGAAGLAVLGEATLTPRAAA